MNQSELKSMVTNNLLIVAQTIVQAKNWHPLELMKVDIIEVLKLILINRMT